MKQIRICALMRPCLVMPDRANRQIGLLDAEGGLGFGQLDVGLPQRFIGPLADVGAQDVDPFSKPRPVGPVGTVRARHADARRVCHILGDRNREGARGAAVTPQQPSDLALDHAAIQRLVAVARMRRSKLASASSMRALKRSCMARSFSTRAAERHSRKVSSPRGCGIASPRHRRGCAASRRCLQSL